MSTFIRWIVAIAIFGACTITGIVIGLFAGIARMGYDSPLPALAAAVGGVMGATIGTILAEPFEP